MESDSKLEYNQIKIRDLKTDKFVIYTIKEISWAADMSINTQCLNPDHKSINQAELWIRRLHEATGLDDTKLRNMDRRTFETLITKWIQINDADQTAFLGTSKTKENL